MKLWTPEEDLREFYQRSVANRRSTGVPGPFEVQSDGQQWETKPIIYPDVTKAVASVQDGAFLAPPTIDSFYPYWGRDTGHDTIDIYGSNFIQGAKVQFGGVGSIGGAFISSTHIQAVTPAHPLSPETTFGVAVEVSNVDPFDPGLSDSLSTFTYEYNPQGAMYLDPASFQLVAGVTYNFAVRVSPFYGYYGFFDLTFAFSNAFVQYISTYRPFMSNGYAGFQLAIGWPNHSSTGQFSIAVTDETFGASLAPVNYTVD